MSAAAAAQAPVRDFAVLRGCRCQLCASPSYIMLATWLPRVKCRWTERTKVRANREKPCRSSRCETDRGNQGITSEKSESQEYASSARRTAPPRSCAHDRQQTEWEGSRQNKPAMPYDWDMIRGVHIQPFLAIRNRHSCRHLLACVLWFRRLLNHFQAKACELRFDRVIQIMYAHETDRHDHVKTHVNSPENAETPAGITACGIRAPATGHCRLFVWWRRRCTGTGEEVALHN